nr:MAG TPA: hypothetical protein [Caudoviricetes sp.]
MSTVNKLKFSNGDMYLLIVAVQDAPQQILGMRRPVRNHQFSVSDYDAIKASLAVPNNLDTITLIKEDTDADGKVTVTEYPYTNYSIVQSFGEQLIPISNGDDQTAPSAETRLVLTLAQLTYLEVTQAAQQAMVDLLTLTTLGV